MALYYGFHGFSCRHLISYTGTSNTVELEHREKFLVSIFRYILTRSFLYIYFRVFFSFGFGWFRFFKTQFFCKVLEPILSLTL